MSIPANPDTWGTDRNCYLAVNSHPGLVDLFLSQTRKAYAQERQKTSVRNKLKKPPETTSPKISAKSKVPELRDLVSLLRYSSNNLNQLTRRAHETGRIYEADLEDIQQSQERIWTAVEKIVSSLAASFNCKYHTSRPCNCTNIIFPIWRKLVQVAVLKKNYVTWLDVV